MKMNPIPGRHAFTQTFNELARLAELERIVNALRRSIEALSKRSMDERNLVNECIQLRHCSDELYGDADDLTNLRFGDAESAGTTTQFPFAPADHKHRLDPILILEKSEPAQITANTNNWALSEDYSFFLVDSDAARNVTGIDGGANGRVIILVNDGSNDITLTNQDANSDAANRIITGTGASVVLVAAATAWLIYDSTASRWRLCGGWGI